MRGLKDHTYLISGGASGIGKATAERILAAGGSVALIDVDAAALERAGQELGRGEDVLAIIGDVSDADQVETAVDRTLERFGSLSGAVTSAGIFDPRDLVDLDALDLGVFERVMAVNIGGTMLVLRAVLPHLAADSSVVTVASTAGLRGHGFGPSYTASKGAVVALTRLIALQYGPRGIRANCVCPGATAGEGMGATFSDADLATQASIDLPLRRVGQAAEVGAVIATLLSDETSYVTGQVIAIDGGAVVR